MNKRIKQSIDVVQYLKKRLKNKAFKRYYDNYGKQTVQLTAGELLRKASADYRNGKNVSPVFSDSKKMLIYLHSGIKSSL